MRSKQTPYHAEQAPICPSDIDPLLTSAQLVSWIGAKHGTLRTWRCYGRGPKWLKLGRRVVYRQSDVEAWLETRERTSTVQNRAAPPDTTATAPTN
jgi:predicted DNA-binding transcriptional regulator AlpA